MQDAYPLTWTGRRAVVTLPGDIDVSNAGQIREELLSVINRGARELIVDMAGTVSCDHAGAEAVARAYQRAAGSGAQLRLVVSAEMVRRVLSVNGLDRLISIYPTLQAATAASLSSAAVVPEPGSAPAAGGGQPPGHTRRAPGQIRAGTRGSAAVTAGVLSELIDALADGVALVADDGRLALVNGPLEAMFGYERGELAGQPVEMLIPAYLRAVHRKHRGRYLQAPHARPMSAGTRLVGLCKNGATVPVEISLSPLLAATGRFTLAMIRSLAQARPEVAETRQHGDLAQPASPAPAQPQIRDGQELLDRAVNNLFQAGLTLREACARRGEAALRYLSAALQDVDDAIGKLRDHESITHR